MKFIALLFIGSGFIFGNEAEKILEQASQALLSGAKAEDIKTFLAKGVIEMPQGMKGQFTMFAKDGSKNYMEMEIMGTGIKMITGCDGTDCFEDNPMLGPRLLEGKELAKALNEANFRRELDWQTYYVQSQYLGKSEVNGKSAHKLKVLTSNDLEMTNYYDTETYFLLKSELVVESPMGSFPTVVYYTDYEVHNGFVTFKTMTTEMMSQKMVMRFQEMNINEDIPDSQFVIPEKFR